MTLSPIENRGPVSQAAVGGYVGSRERNQYFAITAGGGTSK